MPEGDFSLIGGSSSSLTSMRLPPASLEAEQALLGAMLANNKAYQRVSDFLQAEHFADAIHGRIYTAIRRRIDAGQLADAVTLRLEFADTGELADVGGPDYLVQLLSAMVGIINAGEYGRLIHDCYIRRQLIELGETVVNRAFGAEPELAAMQQVAALEGDLLALSRSIDDPASGSLDSASVVAKSAARLQANLDNPGVVMGIPTGIKALDRKLGGLRNGKFYIVAGATSMGKTALAGGMTRAAARAGFKTDYTSGEMPPDEIMDRQIAAEARLPISAVTDGIIEYPDGRIYKLARDGKELRWIGEAQRTMSLLPISWLDAAAPSLASLVSRWRLLKRKGQLDLIVLDYLQLVRASANSTRQNVNVAVTEISQTLKQVAKQLDVPVVALSQLKRGVEEREMKRPQLADLRESGSLEQDADVVILVYRDHYYLKKSKPTQGPKESAADFGQRTLDWQLRCEEAKGKADLDVAKQRGGPTGLVHVAYHDAYTCFADLPEDHHG